MRTLFSRELDRASHLEDAGLRFGYLISVLRAILQHAAVSALEFCYRHGGDYEEGQLAETAGRLLNPNDGDVHHALNGLIPVIRNGGWTSCCSGWFENCEIPGTGQGTARLDNHVGFFVGFRNDRPGHGVVDAATIQTSLLWLPRLVEQLLAGLQDLLPRPKADGRLELPTPHGLLPIETLRLVQDQPILLRRVAHRGSLWKVFYQVLDSTFSNDGFFEIKDTNPIVASALGRADLFSTSCLRYGAKEWHPTVLLPARQTKVFQGRMEELVQLNEWYNNLDSRACLVYGEGGIGKTTLVLEFLHELLASYPQDAKWFPDVVCFFSAKRTRWGPDGLEDIPWITPAVAEAVRQLVRLLEPRLDRKWFEAEPTATVDRATNLFREAGLKRDDILLVLDNTETLARTAQEEDDLARLISRLSSRLCRLMMTSRRHERVEAFPVRVLEMDQENSVQLLRRLGQEYGAKALTSAGDTRLRTVATQLEGKPLLMDVFSRFASHGSRSIDESLQMVLQAARADLGAFLFHDAWQRIGEGERQVYFVLALLGGAIEEQAVGWICGEVGTSFSHWLDTFEETRFGNIVSYETRNDIQLGLDMKEFLEGLFRDLPPESQEGLRYRADSIKKKYVELVRAREARISDRVMQAFRTAPAKAAWLAAKRGAFDEAVVWYEEALHLDAQNALLWDRFAWFLAMQRGELARAKDCTLEACKLAPEDGEVHFTAGLVSARLGLVEATEFHLSKARQGGKPAHLCDLQRARARVAQARNLSRRERRPLLEAAERLLLAATHIPASSFREKKHLGECERIMRQVKQLRHSEE
jgi:tetratricopeptide (TPR) repeat protein